VHPSKESREKGVKPARIDFQQLKNTPSTNPPDNSGNQTLSQRDQARLDEERHVKRRRLELDETSQHSSTDLTGEMTNLTLTQDHSSLRNLQILTENSNKGLSNDTRRAEGEHLSPHTTDWKDHIPDWKDHIGPLVALV